MRSPKCLELLPAEVLLRILHCLSAMDLCSMALVSCKLRQIATDPHLWKNKGLVIKRSKVKSSGVAFLNLRRFSKLTTLSLGRECLVDNLLLYLDQLRTLCTFIIGSNSIKHLNIRGQNNLTRLPVQLVSKAVAKLVTVDLSDTELSTEQVIGIFSSMKESSSLKKLQLEAVDLSSVPSELISDAVPRLTSVKLENVQLKTDQLIPLFMKFATSTTLQDLDLSYLSLHGVPWDFFVEGVKKLKDLNLYFTDLTTIQLTELLKSLAKSTTIENLNLGENDLSMIPADILAKGVLAPNIKVISLAGTNLTMTQMNSMLNGVILHKPIQELNLSRTKTTGIVPAGFHQLLIDAKSKVDLFITTSVF